MPMKHRALWMNSRVQQRRGIVPSLADNQCRPQCVTENRRWVERRRRSSGERGPGLKETSGEDYCCQIYKNKDTM